MDLNGSTEDFLHCKKWQKMFPACVANKADSAAFLSRALFVAFSVIMKRRGLLPDSCFAQNYISDGLKASTLNFKNPTSSRIAELLRNVGVAIKSCHLEELALVISEDGQCEEALEAYTLKVFYDEHGVASAEIQQRDGEDVFMRKLAALQYNGTASVRDQLILTVKSVYYLTGKLLAPLPEKCSFNLRVKYMENCPTEGSVPGFTDSDIYFTDHPEMQQATIGYLRPGHHSSALVCKSICIDDSFLAEKKLSRLNKQLAKNMENGDTLVNNSMYSSMALEESASPEPQPQKTSSMRKDREEVQTEEEEKPAVVVEPEMEEEQLASTVAKIALEPPSEPTKMSQKAGRTRGKRAAKTAAATTHPYARVSSLQAPPTPPPS